MVVNSRSAGAPGAGRNKLYTSYNWMFKKYSVERLTEQEIAELAGTTQATINRWLVKHKLKKDR